jgi:hypothetical protein
MITTDCPRQKAFISELKDLISLSDSEHIFGCDSEQIYQEEFCAFVNKWCPNFKPFKGCHQNEELHDN